jgi:hypothetical protein
VPDAQPKRRRPCEDCGRPHIAGPYARWGLCCRWKHRGPPPTKKKYVWTPERDAIVRERYDSKVRGRADEIGQALGGWPGWVVKKRAATLGLSMPWPADRRDWTPEEVRFLEEHAGNRLTHWIAKRLKRSETSVVLKLKRMKISRRWREGYTLRELELCFGTDHHVIERWIREGLLVGRRRGTRRQGPGGRGPGGGYAPADPWVFEDEDLVRFIQGNPMAFRLDKVDQLWFMDLITAGGIMRRALQAVIGSSSSAGHPISASRSRPAVGAA